MTIPNLFDTLTEYRQSTDMGISTTQSTQDTLVNEVRTTSGTPFWQSPFDGDDVSMPWSEATESYAPTSGQNQIHLTPIVIGKDGYRDIVRVAGGTTTGTPTNVVISLWKINRSSGQIKVLWSSIIGVAGWNGTYRTGAIVSVPFPAINVKQGEAYYVGIHQIGTGYGPYYGGRASTFTRTVDVQYPQDVTKFSTSTTSTNYSGFGLGAGTLDPISYPDGGTRMLWAALGVESIPTIPATYSDFFLRAESTTLGPMWVHRYRSGGSGELRVLQEGVAPPTNVDTNDYISTYVSQMRSNDHIVKVEKSIWGGNVPARIYLPLRCSDAAQCFAVWDLVNGDAQIMTSTAWGITGTTRATDSAPTSFHRMEFQAVGDIYTIKCYDGPHNVGAEIEWDDTTSAHPVGEDQLIVGLGMAGRSMFNAYPWLDNWYASDL